MTSFDSHFRRAELLGWFRWDSDLTSLQPRSRIYHACHKSYVRSAHRANELWLRSKFDAHVPASGIQTFECVWLSLQPWHRTHGHNHFGPFTIKLPMTALDGRRFYVFKRMLKGWWHYYFVQRETKTPLFSGHPAPHCDPRRFFKEIKGGLADRFRTQYELVLTEPVGLRDAKIIATDHRRCVSRDCDGMPEEAGVQIISNLVDREIEKLADRFPQAKAKLRQQFQSP